MIDFGKGLLAAVIREGYEVFLKYNFNIEVLDGEDQELLKEIAKYYYQYKQTPSMGVMEEIAQYPLRNCETDSLAFWIENCKKMFLHNQAKKFGVELNNLIEKNDTEAFYKKCRTIADIHNSHSQQVSDDLLFSSERFSDYIEDVWNNTKTTKTPWPQLDNRLQGGYKPQDLICFAARPGVGKTNVLLLSAIKAWQDSKRVLIIGTEMSVKSMQIRAMFFAKMHNSLGQLRKGMISRYEKQSLELYLQQLENADNIHIVSGEFDLVVDSIESKVMSFKPDILFIDAVYLLKASKNDNHEKNQRIAAVFDKLKIMAKTRDISIVVTTQLNRGGGNIKNKKDEKVDLDRLAFSDNVGMVTDATIFLYQDDEMRGNRKMGFDMGKLREGDCWDDVIVNWDFERNNFTEVSDERKIDWLEASKR